MYMLALWYSPAWQDMVIRWHNNKVHHGKICLFVGITVESSMARSVYSLALRFNNTRQEMFIRWHCSRVQHDNVCVFVGITVQSSQTRDA